MKTFAEPLLEEVTSGRLDEAIIDRALRRVLRQKVELGLLDAGLVAGAAGARQRRTSAIRQRSAEPSTSTRPRTGRSPASSPSGLSCCCATTAPCRSRAPARIAVIGPNADDPYAVLGCYSFPSHVGAHHPEVPIGIDLPTVLDTVRAEFPGAQVDFVRGTTVDGGEVDEFDAAIAAAKAADVVVLVARRPRRPVRTRHERRGLRRRVARPAGSPAGTRRRGARLRNADDRHAARRSAVRARRRDHRGCARSFSRSSRAKRAHARSRAC